MGQVIGPISQSDWQTLRMLRSHIAVLKATNRVVYEDDIDRNQAAYQFLLGPYMEVA
jgi:hypothetical protein